MTHARISCASLVVLAAVAFVETCDSDPKDALFVSTSLGRLINYMMKKCIPIVLTMKPYPSGHLTVEFVKSTCDAIDICEKLIKGDSFQVKVPCIKNWLWAHWLGTEVVPVDQMRIVEKAGLCASAAAPSSRVAKHAMAYFQKISG